MANHEATNKGEFLRWIPEAESIFAHFDVEEISIRVKKLPPESELGYLGAIVNADEEHGVFTYRADDAKRAEITREQIGALGQEAERAGDYEQSAICRKALLGHPGYLEAWDECARVIGDAKGE